MKTSIYDFSFIFIDFGHYRVKYTSPTTGKAWKKTVTNMPLIDSTKNSAYPKARDLNDLKRLVKSI